MRQYLLCWFLFCFSTAIYGQELFVFRVPNNEQMPCNDTYSIAQDPQGFIWVGCDAGLFRYNGFKFDKYTSQAQKVHSITNVVIDKEGRLFCNNFVGQFFYIEDNQLICLEALKVDRVNKVCLGEQGLVWIATNEGLFSYDCVQKLLKKMPFIDYQAYNCSAGADGAIWVNATNLYKIFSHEKYATFDYKSETITFDHSVMANSSEYLLLLNLHTAKIYTIVNDTLVPYTDEVLYQALQGRKVTHWMFDSQNILWVLTYTGIVRYDPKRRTTQTFLTKYSFSHILEDQFGTFWLTTLNSGLVCISDLESLLWTENNKITHVLPTEEGLFWGSNIGEIGHIDLNKKQRVIHLDKKVNISSLNYFHSKKAITFAENTALYMLKDQHVSLHIPKFSPIKDFLSTPWFDFASCSDGLFVSAKGGDWGEREKLFTWWTRKAIFSEQTQTVWAATSKGLIAIDIEQQQVKVKKTYFSESPIVDVAFDKTGLLFAVLPDGTIHRKAEVDTAFELVGKVPEETQVYKFFFDEDFCFFATNLGVFKWNYHTNTWQNKRAKDGLISEKVLAVSVWNDRLWLGTSWGLQSVSKDFNSKNKGKLFLKNILIDDKPDQLMDNTVYIKENKKLTLLIDQYCYNCSESYKIIYTFSSTDGILQRHTLHPSVQYIDINQLPAQATKMTLLIVDQNNNIISNEIEFYLVVDPFWWKKIPYILLLICSFLFIVFLFVRLRIKQIRNKQAKEISLLALDNQLKLWQQKALLLQMNPHFVFNVLNSIKSFIYQKDNKKAIMYLNEFAFLIRTVLNNSEKTLVYLKEEIDLVEKYINLEAMLFDTDFEWKILWHDQPQTKDLLIPSLIIQPIVENAFKHGLRFKKGLKTLAIHIGLKGDALEVVVTDNGVGRKTSAQAADRQGLGMSSSNIEQRIQLIKQTLSYFIDYQVVDMKDENGLALGTKVMMVFRQRKDE